jgi:hypothetical protein
MHTKILAGKLEGKTLLGNRGLDGRIILKWILKKYNVKTWTGIMCVRIGISGGFL